MLSYSLLLLSRNVSMTLFSLCRMFTVFFVAYLLFFFVPLHPIRSWNFSPNALRMTNNIFCLVTYKLLLALIMLSLIPWYLQKISPSWLETVCGYLLKSQIYLFINLNTTLIFLLFLFLVIAFSLFFFLVWFIYGSNVLWR